MIHCVAVVNSTALTAACSSVPGDRGYFKHADSGDCKLCPPGSMSVNQTCVCKSGSATEVGTVIPDPYDPYVVKFNEVLSGTANLSLT